MVDIWYDLAVRALSDLTDPAKERLSEAEASSVVVSDPEPTEIDQGSAPVLRGLGALPLPRRRSAAAHTPR